MSPFNTIEFPIIAQYAIRVSGMFREAQKALNAIPFGAEGRAEYVAKLEEARAVLRAVTQRINEMKAVRHGPAEEDASLE